MQIGRQLNRNTPKLDSEDYSDGLKDLIAYALDSNPSTRPSMADILEHPYIAGTEEEYPTSSVSELVRNYYQWSQRGGQRISLFHPGGAAAAELPGTEESEDDWNFSTTDGFERRFSVIDLDQLAASLAEMEESVSPTTATPDHDFHDDPSDDEINPEDKANFDERVRRGAVAMEGLFDEEKPSYKYETKNDFVPIEPPQPVSDLPLRTDTDRSSVTSTFIDIDIGSFDSSHYAAGAPSAQPFQLADAGTIRANRSSLRGSRSHDNSSQSSVSGEENMESQEEEFQSQSGPRPPTMDWKFPVFSMNTEEDEEIKKEEPAPESAPEPAQEETFQAEKRATMEWTFPVMSDEVSNDSNVDQYDTLRAPLPPLQPVEESDISRPGTSASNLSSASESDYDPFRFDRPTTPQGPNPKTASRAQSFDSTISLTLSNGDREFPDDSSVSLDGPGPDEEEPHPLWNENSEIIDPNNIPPLDLPFPRDDVEKVSTPISEPGSPVYDDPPTVRQPAISRDSAIKRPDSGVIPFPVLIPPSAESLMEGADDAVVTAELERLLDDFLDGLAATGQALSRYGTANDPPDF